MSGSDILNGEESRQEAQRRADAAETRMRLLVESVRHYAIIMLSPDGNVETWNVGATHITGYASNEVIGRHVSVFYTPDDLGAGKWQQELEAATQHGRFEEEGWRVRKDGSRFWANVVLTAVREDSGELIGFAKVTRDLTESRKAEEERVRLAQAQEAVRLRDEFLSIAAHELRTPLTALQLQLQSVRAKATAIAPDVASKLDRITRSTERLTSLIDALLDVSRISTGRISLKLEPVNLSSTVADVVDRMRETAERARCDLVPEIEPSVEAVLDPLRLEQVIANLLSNAIKYAAGTPVRVSLSRKGKEAVLEVADQGSGIPDKDLGRVFGRFERAAPLRHFGGLGLGLYVTREIVEAHGGAVSAHNAKDGGAVFTVRLPLDR
ncbi:MAG: PAS domain-containing sensor histidine kinase [Myxococcaceae bacterium]